MTIEFMIIISVIVYLLIGFCWNLIFLNIIGLAINNKRITGLKLTLLCLFWIIVIPNALKGGVKTDE